MGRKKRKSVLDDAAPDNEVAAAIVADEAVTVVESTEITTSSALDTPAAVPIADTLFAEEVTETSAPATITASFTVATASKKNASVSTDKAVSGEDGGKNSTVATNLSSGYAMATHSGEILQEDVYVSDGSEDSEDDNMEVVLVGSRMGVMRRGLHHPSLLVQPNREWVRGRRKDGEQPGLVLPEEQRRLQEEEELAKLDPAQRAARLLQEKQRKLEEAKEQARRLESEENAGRDPALFSKRTAFDIRFDQIDDKPWTRGTGDMSDFFNYGLVEEDWLEYAQQQLMIRQELTDANRQKRAVDPNIVPVIPKVQPTNKQTLTQEGTDDPINHSASISADGDDEDHYADDDTNQVESANMEVGVGPTAAAVQSISAPYKVVDMKKEDYDVPVGIGGAWGAGAAPGSKLALLIEEQEKQLLMEAMGDSTRQQEQMLDSAIVPSSTDDRASMSDKHYGPSEATEDDAMSHSIAGGDSTGADARSSLNHNHRHDNSSTFGRGGTWYDRSATEAFPTPSAPPSSSYRGRGFAGGRFGGRGGRFGGRGAGHANDQYYGQPWEDQGRGGDYFARKRPRDANVPRDDPRWRR